MSLAQKHYWAWVDVISGNASVGDDGIGPADATLADRCFREPFDPSAGGHYMQAQSDESMAHALSIALETFRRFVASHPGTANDISGSLYNQILSAATG